MISLIESVIYISRLFKSDNMYVGSEVRRMEEGGLNWSNNNVS